MLDVLPIEGIQLLFGCTKLLKEDRQRKFTILSACLDYCLHHFNESGPMFFKRNEINLLRKFAKIMRIFDKTDDSKSQGVI
jgi:hypothetical protein